MRIGSGRESVRVLCRRIVTGWALSAILVASATARAAGGSRDSSIVFLGSFYRERFTEEHEYRDQFDLWREGEHVFGLTSDIGGLIGDQVPTLSRFEGTLEEGTGALKLSNRFQGVLNGSAIVGAYEGDPLDSLRLAQSMDRMGTGPSMAPLSGYVTWRAWADSLIDGSEARNPYLRQELRKCEAGDGWACVGIGNRLRERKPDEARRYWERACELDAWPGCKFLGDQARHRAILLKLCSSDAKPSLHRNMACQELGAPAEKAGRLEEAIEWYRLGCNEYALPTTSCARLKALQHKSGKAGGSSGK